MSAEPQARALLERGEVDAARALLQRALAAGAGINERRLLGQILRVQGRFEQAEDQLRRVLALAPHDRESMLSLIFMLRDQGRLTAANQLLLQHFAASRRSVEDSLSSARFAIECRAYPTAERILAAALGSNPEHALVHGEVLMTLGEFKQAAERFQSALKGARQLAPALFRWSYSANFVDRQDPRLVLLEQARSKLAEDAHASLLLEFASAKAWDELSHTDAEPHQCRALAVRHWQSGNTLAARLHPWNGAAFRLLLNQASNATRPLDRPGAAGGELLLIVGAPRSGTTLVADRLSRQPRIRNRGELNWLQAASERCRQSPQNSASCADLYLSQLRQDDAPAVFYIDKNPMNLLWADGLATLLPRARVLWIDRQPADVALSLWSHHFAHPQLAFSNRWQDLSEVLASYQRLSERIEGLWPRDHWRRVDYAELVGNPGSTLQKLWQWLDLRPATNEPNNVTTAVATASVHQVRQPIHTRSRERWRQYADLLPELAGLARPG